MNKRTGDYGPQDQNCADRRISETWDSFYDISPLLGDGKAWRIAIERLAERIAPYKPDVLIGIESRGFLAAAPLAYELASASP